MTIVNSARFFVTVHCAFVAFAGCNRAADGQKPAASDSSAAAVVRVAAAKPERKTLVLQTTQPARIESFAETPLFAKLAGYVKQVHVDIGDRVHQDDPLVTLAIPELNDDVNQKSAAVAQASAEIKQASAGVEMAKAAVETTAARVAEAQAGTVRASGEYDRWKSEADRIKELAEKGSVTQKLADEMLNQFRSAEAARAVAAAAVQSAEAAVKQARSNVVKAEADETAAEAHLKVAEADREHAKTMLSYTVIRAPFDAIVTQRSVVAGHFVQPAGSTAIPLITVADSQKVRVFVDVPEIDAAKVDMGDPVTLKVQALAGKEIQAAVTRSSWSLDAMNRSLRAEIDLPNPNASLRPGMYATATIDLARRENVLSIPVKAVVRDGDNTTCRVVESGHIVQKRIKLGLQTAADVEVVSGLGENDIVVTAGADSLTNGQAVEVIHPGTT